MISMMACSCSLIPTKEIQVTSKPIDRTIVQPVMPREIDLKEVRWLTITPENYTEQFKIIEELDTTEPDNHKVTHVEKII